MSSLFRGAWAPRLVPACLIFVLCIPIFGQEASAPADGTLLISPQDAVDRAVRSNLSLESARISLDTKERKARYVWNQFLPTVNVSGTLARDNWANTQTIAPGYSITLPQWHALGNFQATLNFSFALVEGINSIKQDYYSGLLSLDKARLQLERDVRKMYNQILLLDENVSLLKNSYANAEAQVAIAQANFNAGLAPRLTLLQAQVQVENMKPTINELENSLKALKGSFAMYLGLHYDTDFSLEPFPPGEISNNLDLAELISKAVAGKPDIIELRQNIVALQSARKAQSLQAYTPFLSFGWTLSGTFNPLLDPFKDGLFNTDNWNKGGTFSLTLGFSLNSFLPFTKEGQAIKDMDNNIKSLNLAMAQLVQGTELEIFSKLNSLAKTFSTHEAQLTAVDLAETSYRLAEDAYRAGLQDFQTVQGSALALDQARLNLLTQRFNYLNDLIDLEYSIGVPFGTLSSTDPR